jgi:DNA-binding PadR family transcriptional regulator
MSPVFAHGQLRLYLLALLNDGPRHGYEVIQDLEQRFNGLYSPSAGTVYPRLAKLEEEGLVERTDEGRKAVYRITDAGRAEVAARHADLRSLESDLDLSVRELADEVRSRVQGESRDLRAELRAAAAEARRTATPVGGHDSRGGDGRSTTESGPVRDIEDAVRQLQREARTAWRRHGLTAEQAREIGDILADATAQIREVVRSGR